MQLPHVANQWTMPLDLTCRRSVYRIYHGQERWWDRSRVCPSTFRPGSPASRLV